MILAPKIHGLIRSSEDFSYWQFVEKNLTLGPMPTPCYVRDTR